MVEAYQIAFMLHTLVEVVAALNFMFFPSKQLGRHSPEAHPIIRQYSLLLLSSAATSFIFARQPWTTSSQHVAAALALYHIGPILRSISRLIRQLKQSRAVWASEAMLFLIVHMCCLASLLSICRQV